MQMQKGPSKKKICIAPPISSSSSDADVSVVSDADFFGLLADPRAAATASLVDNASRIDTIAANSWQGPSKKNKTASDYRTRAAAATADSYYYEALAAYYEARAAAAADHTAAVDDDNAAQTDDAGADNAAAAVDDDAGADYDDAGADYDDAGADDDRNRDDDGEVVDEDVAYDDDLDAADNAAADNAAADNAAAAVDDDNDDDANDRGFGKAAAKGKGKEQGKAAKGKARFPPTTIRPPSGFLDLRRRPWTPAEGSEGPRRLFFPISGEGPGEVSTRGPGVRGGQATPGRRANYGCGRKAGQGGQGARARARSRAAA